MGGKVSSRQCLPKLSIALLSLVVSLLVCEVILRMSNYVPLLTDRNMYVSNNNEILPHKLKANYEGHYFGKKVKIDADGYRIVSPNSHRRNSHRQIDPDRIILLIGDSFVFGNGLSNEETIASQLQNLLIARNLNYQVKNIGVPGYTSWNEYAALMEYLSRYSADLVIVIYTPNDVTFDNDQLGISAGRYSVLADTKLHRLTQFLYRHVYISYLVRDSLQRGYSLFRSNRFSVDYSAYLDDAAIDYSMGALERLQKICKQKGIRFSVGIYRDVWDYDNANFSRKYEEKIKEHLDKRGIESFVIESHVAALGISEARVHWSDPHPSSKAVGFIVGDILREIERRF